MKFLTNSISTFCLFVVLFFAFTASAHAQNVAVQGADPNSTEQGTVNLDVKIKGRGFSSGANVAFFVTGTTNQGGIDVKGVTVHGSKSLTVNIDVAVDADIADFDIEVSLSSGRRGRGTTLFSVKRKGEDAVVFTAELTGAFAFDTENNSVDVTANKRGDVLKSEFPVSLTRPDDLSLQLIWNSVFEKCPNFFAPTMVDVPGFTAPAGKKGWTIEKAGGVRVNFRDIPFPQEAFAGPLNVESAWVVLSLIGDRDFQDSFPPPGTIRLSHFTIYGQTESGVTPRLACDDENFALIDFPIEPPIFLTITPTNTE